MPGATVIASEDEALALWLQEAINSLTFRVYVNNDLIGVELCAAAKNVIALAAGGVDGLGLGDNAKAALITRGLVEMARLGEALGADPETFSGLAGMGDLIVTCWHPSGRNRRAGELIARGDGRRGEGADRPGRRGADDGAGAARPLAAARRRAADHRRRLRGASAACRSDELAASLMGRRPTGEVSRATPPFLATSSRSMAERSARSSSPRSRSPRATRTRSPTRSRTPSSTRRSPNDPLSRVACETLITTGLVVVAGEITTDDLRRHPAPRARDRIKAIGYTRAKYGFDAETCGVIVALDEQSPDIAQGVDTAYEVQHDPATTIRSTASAPATRG